MFPFNAQRHSTIKISRDTCTLSLTFQHLESCSAVDVDGVTLGHPFVPTKFSEEGEQLCSDE